MPTKVGPNSHTVVKTPLCLALLL